MINFSLLFLKEKRNFSPKERNIEKRHFPDNLNGCNYTGFNLLVDTCLKTRDFVIPFSQSFIFLQKKQKIACLAESKHLKINIFPPIFRIRTNLPILKRNDRKNKFTKLVFIFTIFHLLWLMVYPVKRKRRTLACVNHIVLRSFL